MSELLNQRDQFGPIEHMIEQVEQSVQHDLVPLLHSRHEEEGEHGDHEVGESVTATLTEALMEGLVKAEAEAVQKAEHEHVDD